MNIERYETDIPAAAVAAMDHVMTHCFAPDERELDLAERLAEKRKPLALLAVMDGEPVGFKLGYERNPGVFSSWLGGVVPARRRQGVARTLMREQHAWCAAKGYHTVLTESDNAFRNMIILNLREGFQIVGTQYGLRRRRLGILFAKRLDAPADA